MDEFLTIRDVIYIHAIYEEGNVTRAASKLYISQPALSKYLKNIENRLGMELFDRSKNPWIITEFGKEYLKSGQKLMLVNKELEQTISDFKEDMGKSLNIGIAASAKYFILEYVVKFKTKFPNVKVNCFQLSKEILEKNLLDGTLDLIVISGTPTETCESRVELVKKEKFYLTAPESWFDGLDECMFDDMMGKVKLDHMPFIVLTEGQRTRRISDRVFTEYNIIPDITLTISSSNLAARLCSEGLGLCFLSEGVKKDPLLQYAHLKYYQLNDNYIESLYIKTRKGSYISSSTREFLKIIRGTK